MKTIRRMAIIVLLASLGALVQGLLLGFPGNPSVADEWGIELEAVAGLGPVIWVDARPATAFEERHFPDAIHLSEDDWDSGLGRLLENWEPGKTILVYCDGQACESSRTIARQLRQDLGDEQIFWLIGGWEHLEGQANGL